MFMSRKHLFCILGVMLFLVVCPVQVLSMEPPRVWMTGRFDPEASSMKLPIYHFQVGAETGDPIAEIEWMGAILPGFPFDLAFNSGNRLLVGGLMFTPGPEDNEAAVWRVQGPPLSVDESAGLLCSRPANPSAGSPGIDMEGGILWFSDRQSLSRCDPSSDGSLPWVRQDYALPPDAMGNKALAVHNGKVYVGLRQGPSFEAVLSVFDPDTLLFSEVGSMPNGESVFMDFDHFGRLWMASYLPPPPGAQGGPKLGLLVFWRVDDIDDYDPVFVDGMESPVVSGMAIGPISVLDVPGLGRYGWILLALFIAIIGGVFLFPR